jgi:hypothetical protein
VRHDDDGGTVVRGIRKWLPLAAAPTFAIMALLAAVTGGGPFESLCSTALSPIGGMIPMYLLMSAFHLPPWLNLIAGQRGRGRHS